MKRSATTWMTRPARHEHDAFGCARALAHQDEAGDGYGCVLRDRLLAQRSVMDSAEPGELLAEKPDRMLFERQPGRHVIFDDVLA